MASAYLKFLMLKLKLLIRLAMGIEVQKLHAPVTTIEGADIVISPGVQGVAITSDLSMGST